MSYYNLIKFMMLGTPHQSLFISIAINLFGERQYRLMINQMKVFKPNQRELNENKISRSENY